MFSHSSNVPRILQSHRHDDGCNNGGVGIDYFSCTLLPFITELVADELLHFFSASPSGERRQWTVW
jgi:hypothetical protein